MTAALPKKTTGAGAAAEAIQLGYEFAVNALDVLVGKDILGHETWDSRYGCQLTLSQLADGSFRDTMVGAYEKVEDAVLGLSALDGRVAALRGGDAVAFLIAMHDGVLRLRLTALLSFCTASLRRSVPACSHVCGGQHPCGPDLDLDGEPSEGRYDAGFLRSRGPDALAGLYDCLLADAVRSLVSALTTLACVDPAANTVARPDHRYVDPDRRQVSREVAGSIRQAETSLRDLDAVITDVTARGDRFAADTLVGLRRLTGARVARAVCSARHIAVAGRGVCRSAECVGPHEPPF